MKKTGKETTVDSLQVIALRKAGNSYDQIARALGCTRGTVQWIVIKNGVQIEQPAPPFSEMWG